MTGRQDPAGTAAGPAGPYVDEYLAGPLPSGEPRSWEEIRAAALAAVRDPPRNGWPALQPADDADR